MRDGASTVISALGLFMVVAASPADAVTTVSMDFLNPGAPVVGATTIDGVGVTVQGGPGSQTSKSSVCIDAITGCGPAAIADARLMFQNGTSFDVNRFLPGQTVSDTPESFLTFNFSRRVTAITFDVARLAPDEIIETDLGVPGLVNGDLTLGGLAGFSILSAGPGDLNKGSVTYTGLNTTSFQIYYGTNGAGSAANPGNASIIGIGVAPVPVPATLPLLAAALGGLGLVSVNRRRRRPQGRTQG